MLLSASTYSQRHGVGVVAGGAGQQTYLDPVNTQTL
jgi:hypothetical protein